MTRANIIAAHPRAKISHSRARDRNVDRLRFELRAVRVLAAPFGFVFWHLERWAAHLQDEIERRA
jgi:hypothetical protein